jgi:uncharacterized delta-60 repeat protein
MISSGIKIFLSMFFYATISLIGQEIYPSRQASLPHQNKSGIEKALPFRLRSLNIGSHHLNDTAFARDQLLNTTQLLSAGEGIPASIKTDVHEIVGDVTVDWVNRYSSNLLPSDDYANDIVTGNQLNVHVTGVGNTSFTGADYFTIKYNKRGDSLWTRRFNGRGNGFDEATSLVVDNGGNVFVTGYSYNGATGFDIVTVKYTSDGIIEWIKEYNGQDDSTDVSIEIALDKDGNIYLTGYEYSASNGIDIITIKYNSSGTEQWTRKFNGPAGGDDRPTAINIDPAGNCFVTGFSNGLGTGADFLIIKYDPNGTELWSDRYSSAGSTEDISTSAATDSFGNSYLTGYSYQATTSNDYMTIKYTQDGIRQWVSIYNDSLNGSDYATAIGIDDAGNVFVTGSSWGGLNSDDYLTIQYDSSGLMKWSRRYDGTDKLSDVPTELVVDDQNGKVYVTGSINYQIGGPRDIVTIQYSKNGDKLWIDQYNGPASSDDYPASIVLDIKGNVFIVGSSKGEMTSYDLVTLKYLGKEYDQWPSRFNNGSGNNWTNAMTIDQIGNVYVIGTDSSHYLIVKYDSIGVKQWSEEFGQSGSNATGIAVDGSGNVYVTGYSLGLNNNLDYATLKYDASGNQKWVAWYNGTADDVDRAFAITLDSSGSVYVTGTSAGAGTRKDYLTIKYDSLGIQKWIARYNGSSNLDESAVSLALDKIGNVYVTGTGVRIGSSNDFLTIKYNSKGAKVWDIYYDGTGNGTDVAKAIAVDDVGSVYITGRSFSSLTLSDYVTIKYNTYGIQEWIARYDGPENNNDDPVALTVDANNNVYVTGSSYSDRSSLDFLTVKYNTSGNIQWVRAFNGTGNGPDQAIAISTDEFGDAYITGTSLGNGTMNDIATIKYTSTGELAWAVGYNDQLNADDAARAIAIDRYGYFYVGGNSVGADSKQDILILKYRVTGTPDQAWPARADGRGVGKDIAKTFLVDSLGQVYIAARSKSPISSDDYSVIKYDQAGTQQWVSMYNGPFNDDDYVSSIAKDKSGNVYLTGTLYSQFNGCDYGTVKFSQDGTRLWDVAYNGPMNSFDFASGVAVDDSQYVYVTGYSESNTSYDCATVKYDVNGKEIWASRYDGPVSDADFAYAIAIDPYGFVYITGFSFGYGTGSDYVTIKYNPDGSEQWVARYNGPGAGDDKAVAIAVDDQSHVCVTGVSAGLDKTYDIITIMYDSLGNEMWAAVYSGGIKSNDQPKAITYDKDGNVYVAGNTYQTDNSSYDYVTIKYNKLGEEQWHVKYDGPAGNADIASSITVDYDGGVYVTGKSIGLDMFYHYATIKYNSSGGVEWTARYSSFDGIEDNAVSVGLDDKKNVYVTGTNKSSEWSAISTIKYFQLGTSVQDDALQTPKIFQLSQNYPNPFNPTTIIRYQLPVKCWVTIKIFNLLGQEVMKLVDENQDPGVREIKLNASALPSGMYFYHLKTSLGFSETKKMLLVK